MKSNKIFKALTLFFFMGLAVSCSDSSSDDGGGSGGDDTATSITLSGSSSSITEGESVSFTVMDDLNNNVTSSSSFTVDGLAISNPHTFSSEGSFSVVASYNSLTSNTVTVSVGAVQPSSITLTSSDAFLFSGGSTQLTVMDDLGNDVTSTAIITVDGNAISANPYTFSATGDYVLQATLDALTSNDVDVSVYEEESFSASGAPNSYTTKILLSDFTGTWCGACPIAGEAIHSAKAGNSNIIPVGYHDNDIMENDDAVTVDNFFGINSYPTVLINGAAGQWSWSNFPLTELDPYLNASAPLGLGISASKDNSKIRATVKVGYASNPGNVKIAIYVLEDGFVQSQANFYVTSHPDPWPDYVHNDILRKSFTHPLGDNISAGNVAAGGIYTKTIIEDIPSTIADPNKIRIVAFVADSNNNILNIQSAGFGVFEIQDFD